MPNVYLKNSDDSFLPVSITMDLKISEKRGIVVIAKIIPNQTIESKNFVFDLKEDHFIVTNSEGVLIQCSKEFKHKYLQGQEAVI